MDSPQKWVLSGNVFPHSKVQYHLNIFLREGGTGLPFSWLYNFNGRSLAVYSATSFHLRLSGRALFFILFHERSGQTEPFAHKTLSELMAHLLSSHVFDFLGCFRYHVFITRKSIWVMKYNSLKKPCILFPW